MNMILLFEDDFVSTQKVRLSGRRFEHVKDILKATQGKELTVGQVNGKIGRGKVLELGKDYVDIDVENASCLPPASLNITLIMAMPRPPMFRRTLQCVTSLGVKKIIILNFSRVEKSFWQSSTLRPESIREDLILGLEQAKDTILPEVILEKAFKPFVEDELPKLIQDKKAFVAHPGEEKALPKANHKGVVLIIGPEGGLVDYEVELLKSKGIQAVSLGDRIVRFENVIPYCIGKLF
ncbi:MAG: 16S rRNA (uracil(1498)-N(3))-methyltransferase [Candidatus Omnitrophica bacterium]|nr:16S rRNA (uracil(1498)-N(3))-methyltransferase [Candidatus Omnitrophota bacterium]